MDRPDALLRPVMYENSIAVFSQQIADGCVRVSHGVPDWRSAGSVVVGRRKPPQWRGAPSGRSKAGRTSSPAAAGPALRERAAARAAARARPPNHVRDGAEVRQPQRQSAGPSTSSPAAILGAATGHRCPAGPASRNADPRAHGAPQPALAPCPLTMPQPAAAPSRPRRPAPPSRPSASLRCSSRPPNHNCPADRFPGRARGGLLRAIVESRAKSGRSSFRTLRGTTGRSAIMGAMAAASISRIPTATSTS